MSVLGYTKAGADAKFAPVSTAWQASTAVKAGQLLTHSGTTYVVNADMTTPSSFNTTGLTVVGDGASSGSGAVLAPQALQTGSFVAAVGKFWPIDTTSATTVVSTLPIAPADGSQVELKVDAGPTSQGLLTHPVTVNLGGSDRLNVAGGNTTFQLTTLRQSVLLQYQAAGALWHVVGDGLSLAQLQALFVGVANAAPLSNAAPQPDGIASPGTSTSSARDDHVHPSIGLPGVAGRWGDGSDGTVVISTNTSLSRDMYYDNLTVNAGVTLTTNGWRVYVRNTLTINSTGVIGFPGLAGGSGTNNFGGGPAGTAQVLGAPHGGAGNGGTGVGTAGANSSNTLVVSPGGAGGTGSGGAGGTGGTAPAVATAMTLITKSPSAAFDFTFIANGNVASPQGGGQGGGGGGDGTNAGGGGSSGGGVCLVNARVIFNNGSMNANGGTGRTPTTGNVGGGGGGGGGIVFVNTTSLSGSGTITASAGPGGAGVGTGTAGTAGSPGFAQTIIWTA